jgi:beta-galactosidase
MKSIHYSIMTLTLVIIFIGFTGCSSYDSQENQRTLLFDQEWRFIKDDPPGAEKQDFDDSGWKILDLPHDWSIEDLPYQNGDSVIGPFSKASIGKMGTGYTVGGTAWYRKHFTIDRSDQGKMAYLQFDGIYI